VEPIVETAVQLWRELHQQVRQEIRGLDAEALNWAPGPETNSIAVLVTHLLGSELEMWRVVRGLPSDRDRASEFVVRPQDRDELERRLDAANAALEEHGPAVTPADLSATRDHPRRGPNSGGYWLLSNYGHANQHLAVLQLTKQLYRQRQGG
jgi:hypothetical protein